MTTTWSTRMLRASRDPRGELITIQHALANHLLDDSQRAELRAREFEVLEDHDVLWGFDMRSVFHEGIEWHNGFIRSARVDECGFSQDSRTIDHEFSITEALELLLDHPSSLLIEDLVLATDRATGWSSRDNDHSAVGVRELALIERYRPYRLRSLTINDRWSTHGTGDKPSCYDISWYTVAGMDSLSRGAPDLAELTLYAGDFLDLEELELPRLRSLAPHRRTSPHASRSCSIGHGPPSIGSSCGSDASSTVPTSTCPTCARSSTARRFQISGGSA